ncbi:GerMN domain-containing protein [Leucobacter sp. CSA2]|uniref:GerMN domain-containing protein n=1 Tax=Leucobacter edaphi TaxID=2796472 RepID=A0A934UXT2_9MICO|nr:LpqB family beta-propeller domain-containing protein [Leucobacter edaphi]MBK0422405.1 GerMN domain-containing protein [Leucobacter edaphi]
MRTRSRWRRMIATAVLAGLALTGCSTIPSAGPVQNGLPDLEQAEQYIQFNPQRPITGASQADLVAGFLQAGSAPADDYAIAREYLTPAYAEQWDPDYGVLVDNGSRPYHSEGDRSGALSVSATAKVDAQGLMLPVEPGSKTELRFEFEKIGSEWRISSAPSGIVLDTAMFQTIWSQHQLYFIGPGKVLVPESRWYLIRASTATEIVNALIEGPSERLRESARTGFPAGTELASGTVPIVDGRAQIDLSGAMLSAGPAAASEMRQQLKASLQAVRAVNGFDLLAEGTAVRETSVNPGGELLASVDISNPAVVVNKELGNLVTGQFKKLPEPLDTIPALDARSISLSHDEKRALVLGAHGVSLVREEGTDLIDNRPGLLSPSYDLLGYAWTTTVDAGRTVRVTAPDGTPASIAVPWLTGRRTVALRVSPDGSRLAALVEDDGGSEILVGGIVREKTGQPLRTSAEADALLWAKGRPVDFDWVGTMRFAVLSRADTATKVTRGGLGTFPTEQGSVPGGSRISGGGSSAQIRVLGEGGGLFAPQASGWQRVKGDVQLLAKRG